MHAPMRHNAVLVSAQSAAACLALSRAALSAVSWRSVAKHSSSWDRRRRSLSCSSRASWSWRLCKARSLSPRAVLTDTSCPFTLFSRSTSCSYTSCRFQTQLSPCGHWRCKPPAGSKHSFHALFVENVGVLNSGTVPDDGVMLMILYVAMGCTHKIP